MKERAQRLIQTPWFTWFIMAVIVLNAVSIGIQTGNIPDTLRQVLVVLDAVCLAIYVIEAVIKIYALGGGYFRDGWNIFDFLIVVLSLVPTSIIPIPVQAARIIRLARVVRVMKLVSASNQMRVIVEAIGKSIPGIAWTAALLLIVSYVFDLIGVSLYGAQFPELFGDLGTGMLTLFQLMTLEGWADITRDVMQLHPHAWVYFVPYVIISAFIMVNVVVGIVVNTIDESRKAAELEQVCEESELRKEIASLRAQLETVQLLLNQEFDAHGTKKQ